MSRAVFVAKFDTNKESRVVRTRRGIVDSVVVSSLVVSGPVASR